MRLMRTFCAVIAAVVWAAGSGLAQAPLTQSIADPRSRFTISFPADWQVMTKEDGAPAVLGVAPPQVGHRVSVNVVVETLPGPMPPAAYAKLAERLLRAIFRDYVVVQEGAATVAGRPAYFRYFTWKTQTDIDLYQLQAFFTVGKTGFVVTGSTTNDPDRVRRDFPLITQIVNTFQPAAPTPGSP